MWLCKNRLPFDRQMTCKEATENSFSVIQVAFRDIYRQPKMELCENRLP